ncbi:GNAT family protein [Actinomyces massiliensis]|uniref:Acetyltransferase (GNAT) domain protein n=1 Tax=Actinomyces massiliensis F0489 TaxID=1125718 RepID=J1HMD4_9ACTO|nr:GNAT family protein [Actinomyces massiliensis]EJF46733.1 acetyltransferase (GNAT) domain protein [Actinomyces massiliensis F0489]WLD70344.1 GNAT family protein [Actinomyces massiliensis]
MAPAAVTPGSAPSLSSGPLVGDVVRLEPLALEHVPALREAAADAGTTPFASVPAPDAVEAYVMGSLRRRNSGSYAPFAQIEAATGRAVGHTAYLTPRRMPDGRLYAVEIGSSWLSPAVRGTAINPAAKLLLMTQAFEDWGVVRLDIKTDARNEVARRAIAGTGARFEGVLHAWQPSLAPGEEGRTRDTAMFCVTAGDWPRVKDLLKEKVNRRLAVH